MAGRRRERKNCSDLSLKGREREKQEEDHLKAPGSKAREKLFENINWSKSKLFENINWLIS